MGWVKCSEKLPESGSWIICFLPVKQDPQIIILKLYIYKWTQNGERREIPLFTNVDRSWALEDVSHWMPLPPRPEL